jgi:excisionase family DNA binding protein
MAFAVRRTSLGVEVTDRDLHWDLTMEQATALRDALNGALEGDSQAYYSPTEAACVLKVSLRTMREWLRTGKVPARKIGRIWRIPREVVRRS